jgi:hypothetical protein
MSQEESKDIETNLKWLASLLPTLPDLKYIEPIVQSLALIGFYEKYTSDELIIIGVAGLLTAKARTVDETRFQEITPNEYLHHSYVLLKLSKKEPLDKNEFLGILDKIL